MKFALVACAVAFVTAPVGNVRQYQSIPVELPAMTVQELVNPTDLQCLALNIYFEARNQKTVEAKASVGWAVINRVHHPKYPDTVCEVVEATRKVNGAIKCQFSWYCDAIPNEPNTSNVVEARAWEEAKALAYGILEYSVPNPIEDAIMYHTTAIKPYWMASYDAVSTVGSHIFYR